MAKTEIQAPPAYQKLIADVTRLYQSARKSLAQFYWKTGQRLVEVEQDGAVHAHYGEGLLKNISRDLLQTCGPGFSVQNLQRMRQTYLRNPKYSTSSILSWAQQVELLPVKAAKVRARLEDKAIHENLSARKLRTLVRQYRSSGKKFSGAKSRSPLAAIKGKAGVYRIVEIEEKLHWDRGFESYRQLSAQQSKGLKDGDIVRPEGAGRFEKIRGGKHSDLYTYEAGLIRVIDADTFWMRLWTQRPEWRKEKLRLRGIDAPELSTPEGKAAKRFVEGLFKKAQSVTVTTTKPDKYHRYLSDVYLKMPDGAEIFLNHHLLQTGRAVRMAKIPPSEWEKE